LISGEKLTESQMSLTLKRSERFSAYHRKTSSRIKSFLKNNEIAICTALKVLVFHVTEDCSDSLWSVTLITNYINVQCMDDNLQRSRIKVFLVQEAVICQSVQWLRRHRNKLKNEK